MKKIVTGNEAIALGALRAGVKVVSGYPGTPSSQVIGSLWPQNLPGTKVEWSTNEKVAFEIAAGTSLAGYRAMCTMKMSGVNVAYDSLIGFAYSGCRGGLVIYVADDPGVTAGMCEQDTRGFAVMSDLPVLEPGSVQESYTFIQTAFELSEQIRSPVFVRSVTNVAESHAVVDVGERVLPKESLPFFEKNIAKYTKAGAVICMDQHRDLIARLAAAETFISKKGLNKLSLSEEEEGVGVISVGDVNSYFLEALEDLKSCGIDIGSISHLQLIGSVPYPVAMISKLIDHCKTILVLEELEPYLEKIVYQLAYQKKAEITIIGKLDGTYSRIGEYNAALVIKGICSALKQPVPAQFFPSDTTAESNCAARPITFCAGCPHRGVYMALNSSIKKLGYKKDDIVITGDIGCTILGMNPPFNTLWTELAMGASIPLAQGMIYTDRDKPVLATIGDSTFFHAGMPGLVNVIQHNINITIVVLDNGWTAMTGMQVNPGTIEPMQRDQSRQIDLAKVIEGFGVDKFAVVDPYNQAEMEKAIVAFIPEKGVKVILARRECAIEARRRKVVYSPVVLDPEKCILCKACIKLTGCPALSIGKESIKIDYNQCNGCGLCTQVCKPGALTKK